MAFHDLSQGKNVLYCDEDFDRRWKFGKDDQGQPVISFNLSGGQDAFGALYSFVSEGAKFWHLILIGDPSDCQDDDDYYSKMKLLLKYIRKQYDGPIVAISKSMERQEFLMRRGCKIRVDESPEFHKDLIEILLDKKTAAV